jgi:hypothetical protein
MIKQGILPMKSAPLPPRRHKKGSVHESDGLDRAFVHACAEPFVQVIQAVKTSEATA